MDDNVLAAVGAVGLTDSEITAWFDAVRAVYEEADADDKASDWSQLSSALSSGLPGKGVSSTAIEQFLAHLDGDSSPLDTVRGMAETPVTELASTYRGLLAGDSGDAGDAGGQGTAEQPQAEDPEKWATFLATNGPTWNGTEAAWEQFKTWFLYQAGEDKVAGLARQFIDYVSAQPDKIAVFEQYGVRIARPAEAQSAQPAQQAEQQAAPDVAQFPDLAVGASGEFVDYLDKLLASKGF